MSQEVSESIHLSLTWHLHVHLRAGVLSDPSISDQTNAKILTSRVYDHE